jgi:hypothetical protein
MLKNLKIFPWAIGVEAPFCKDFYRMSDSVSQIFTLFFRVDSVLFCFVFYSVLLEFIARKKICFSGKILALPSKFNAEVK